MYVCVSVILCVYRSVPNPNAANVNIVADLYAEVIGVLAQSRYQHSPLSLCTLWLSLTLLVSWYAARLTCSCLVLDQLIVNILLAINRPGCQLVGFMTCCVT